MSEPIPFTEEQRQLFRRVAEAIRSWPEAYLEAGRWLDEQAVAEAFEEVRRAWLSEARYRRQQSREHGREVGRFWMVPPPIGRSDMGREKWRERREMRNPSNWRIIDAATHALRSDPLNYDALRPDLAERMARRVLLLVWIMTDPRDLATSPCITKLQAWDWGQEDFEAVPVPLDCDDPRDPLAGMGLKINRLYARIQVLDQYLGEWEQMARAAVRHLEEAGLLLPPRKPDGSTKTEIPDAKPDKSDNPYAQEGTDDAKPSAPEPTWSYARAYGLKPDAKSGEGPELPVSVPWPPPAPKPSVSTLTEFCAAMRKVADDWEKGEPNRPSISSLIHHGLKQGALRGDGLAELRRGLLGTLPGLMPDRAAGIMALVTGDERLDSPSALRRFAAALEDAAGSPSRPENPSSDVSPTAKGKGSNGDVTPAGGKPAGQRRRRGRLTKDESEAKRTSLLARIRQHPSLKDHPAQLASMVGVSESTVRRWLEEEQRKYEESKVPQASRTTGQCRHCRESIPGNERCPDCDAMLPQECPDCHRERSHGALPGNE